MSTNVTDSDFQTAVLDESKNRPVLVDFWAEWCGPCKMLGPVLEKLETQYNGRFVLAKLDTDRNPATSARYSISSIPAVKLFVGGQVVDEFVGALPEPRLKTFLDKHLPDETMKALEAQSLQDPIATANTIVSSRITGEKASELLWLGAVTALSKNQSIDSVLTLLEAIPDFGHQRSDAKKSVIAFLKNNPGQEELVALHKVLSPGKEAEGLDFFISRVENSRDSDREKSREAVLACFQILGNAGPIVTEYRKILSRLLF